MQKTNKTPKSMQELFNTMQQDVANNGRLSDEYLDEIEAIWDLHPTSNITGHEVRHLDIEGDCLKYFK